MNAANVSSSRSKTGAREIFFEDIRETEEYLSDMKSHIKELCIKKGLQYPRRGRGCKGIFPNIPYALHFRLQGLNPKKAAEMYVKAESGRTLQPIEAPAGVAC